MENPAVESGYGTERLRSALSVPLETTDQLFGTLTLYRTIPNAFSAEDLHMMMAASNIFAAAVANSGQTRMPVPTRKNDFLPQPAFALQPVGQALLN